MNKLDEESSTRRHVNVRLEKDLYAALKLLCRKGWNFSRVVNAALREWLQQKGGGA